MALHSASQPLPSSSAGQLPSHRLPTVSATQALKNLQTNAPSPLKTGLPQLDALLGSNGNLESDSLRSPLGPVGVQRGTVTEIWGPSGSGKTTLASQLAAHALSAGNKVMWADASTPLPPTRLTTILSTLSPSPPPLSNLHHLSLPTLSHLLTLLLYPPSSLPLQSTSLLIITNIHSPLDAAYPRFPPNASRLQSEAQKWAANRRYAVTGSLIQALRKVAVVHGLAVVATSNAVTRGRGRGEGGAVLVSAMGGVEWERGVGGRVGCFRDYSLSVSRRGLGDWKDGWFLGVTKVGGKTLVEGDGEVGVAVGVEVGVWGMREVRGRGGRVGGAVAKIVSPVKSKGKRTFEEVGDSDDEMGSEYGWDEGDEVAAEGLIDEDDVVLLGERKAEGKKHPAEQDEN
ncbi:DNA repair protein rhp55 [Elsinoe australis]|uniref:DNA repair protein rhp55 n=1 Tax=Elsinoe australis TaxID=40998 RepID=A0A2P8A0Z3_9PEZI|nr:DNA repair protein rhp55 [Elsinoe australis]